jgi:hypothetical protein
MGACEFEERAGAVCDPSSVVSAFHKASGKLPLQHSGQAMPQMDIARVNGLFTRRRVGALGYADCSHDPKHQTRKSYSANVADRALGPKSFERTSPQARSSRGLKERKAKYRLPRCKPRDAP